MDVQHLDDCVTGRHRERGCGGGEMLYAQSETAGKGNNAVQPQTAELERQGSVMR
jgi:hypothetical protein